MGSGAWLAVLLAMPLAAQAPDAPGRLFDLGGRKMHILCMGSGAPTVVLEAGASSFSLDWTLVQPEIAKTNRVCSYDRARLGWSDPGPGETSANFVKDLRRLLEAAGEEGPYVLVGASMGGLYVRLFQMEYPREVVGMVLVDPVQEFRLYTSYEGKTVPVVSLSAEQYRSVMPKADVKIPRRTVQAGEPFSRLPERAFQARVQLDQRTIDSYPPTVSAAIVGEQAESERATFVKLNEARLKTPAPLGSLPLVVLTRGLKTDPERIAANEELARMSTNSKNLVVDGAGHEIHLYRPQAVIEAVREVVGRSRRR